MTQLKRWSMTSDLETFRQGATAFRNARDWTKDQRDEAIRYANDRANDIPSTTPIGFALAFSFTIEVSTLVAATSLSIAVESQSQESPTTQIEAFYSSETARVKSETSTDEFEIDLNPPAKRCSRSRQSRYRKRNTEKGKQAVERAREGVVLVV